MSSLLVCDGVISTGDLLVETDVGNYWVQINVGGPTINYRGLRCSTTWQQLDMSTLPTADQIGEFTQLVYALGLVLVFCLGALVRIIR